MVQKIDSQAYLASLDSEDMSKHTDLLEECEFVSNEIWKLHIKARNRGLHDVDEKVMLFFMKEPSHTIVGLSEWMQKAYDFHDEVEKLLKAA